MSLVERHFVTVGARQVHYRRAGAGSPIVLLHASPLSSRSLLPLVAAVARTATAIALDTPGYGASDPLPEPAPEIGDYADALAATLDALALPRVHLYGVDTGACIALELALRQPERVARLFLDRLPRVRDDERAERLASYAPVEPRWDGTHLVAAWCHRRDHALFDPWYRRDAAHRLHRDLPSPLQLHDETVELLRARPGYELGHRATLRYRPGEAPAATVVVDGGSSPDEIAALLAQGQPLPDAPPPPASSALAGRTTRSYVTTPTGQLLVRRLDGAAGRPLVLLHPSTVTSEIYEPLLVELARQRPVVALDSPGYGESDPLPGEGPGIEDIADALGAGLEALGLDTIDLFGGNTGALAALELALGGRLRVENLILDGVPMPDPDMHERFAPPLEISRDGTHLLTAWSFARDTTLFFPWYEPTEEHIRSTPPGALAPIHARTVEILKSGPQYRHGPRAAFAYPTPERLRRLAVRTLICAEPTNVMAAGLAAAREAAPSARQATRPDAPAEAALFLGRFLDGDQDGK